MAAITITLPPSESYTYTISLSGQDATIDTSPYTQDYQLLIFVFVQSRSSINGISLLPRSSYYVVIRNGITRAFLTYTSTTPIGDIGDCYRLSSRVEQRAYYPPFGSCTFGLENSETDPNSPVTKVGDGIPIQCIVLTSPFDVYTFYTYNNDPIKQQYFIEKNLFNQIARPC